MAVGLHDVESVLEYDQIVGAHRVDLGVYRGRCPEHGLPVVAAYGEVVDRDTLQVVEVGAVGGEPVGPAFDLHLERAYLRLLDDDLPHHLVALEAEGAHLAVVERDAHLRGAAADEEQACAAALLQMPAARGHVPACGCAVGGRGDPARDEEVTGIGVGHALALHDVVWGPPLGCGLDGLAEAREGRGCGYESDASAAEGLLKHLAQVGREDVALDERVAHEGYAHGLRAVEQFVV